MAIQITRWSPDTCRCVIDYQWDDSVPQEKREHTVSSIVSKCSFHDQLPDDNTHYGTVIDENQNKNIVLSKIQDNVPAATETDTKGNVSLKEGVILWSFDSNRNLVIEAPTLSSDDLFILEAAVSTDAIVQLSSVQGAPIITSSIIQAQNG